MKKEINSYKFEVNKKTDKLQEKKKRDKCGSLQWLYTVAMLYMPDKGKGPHKYPFNTNPTFYSFP